MSSLKPVAVLGLALCFMGCSGGPPPKKELPPPEVAVAEVAQRDVPVYGEWVGTLDGLVNAKIKAQVTGYLLRREYQEGSFVRKGQLLFELDPRTFEAAVAQAQGQLAQARGQLEAANSQRKSAQAALSQANSQLLLAKAGLEQAQGMVMQAEANLAQQQANQGKTQLDEDRYRPLAERKAVPQQDLDNAIQNNQVAKAQVAAQVAQLQTARGQFNSAKAQVDAANSTIQSALAQISSADAAITTALAQIESANAQLQTAQLNLGFTKITSPIDGLAGVASAQVGDLISPSSEPLTQVSTIDPIKVNFTIPEQEYMSSLKRNPAASRRAAFLKTLRFELIQSDGSKYPQPGRFYSEDRNVTVNTGAILLTALFPNPQGNLRPGQYARVRTVRYVQKSALLIPQRAVTELQDRYQVAVVGPDQKIAIQPVKVGERIGQDWIITDGLQPGQTVVVEGTQKLGPGATVKTKPYEPQASATPAGPK
ncbi:MAG: efflux RND transporter periplasmic adaptor subunit [Candidatus Eremiobacteraeota bacterium]|nr:efflux RND transporter periplasmic adaptor subunit [Candidatus Eremiobacteraeota bacterium]MCW5869943.1 efflux RND transporter periplasmic adaptor subunit [Candidatus Eremiobacteraeota bacterium]